MKRRMAYPTAVCYARSEANLAKTPQYVCMDDGTDVNRFWVVCCAQVFGIIPGIEQSHEVRYAHPVLTVLPACPWDSDKFSELLDAKGIART